MVGRVAGTAGVTTGRIKGVCHETAENTAIVFP